MSPGLVNGGGSVGGAILAAMDLGAAPGSAPPASLLGLFPGSSPANHGSNGSGVHVQLHALGKIHENKASCTYQQQFTNLSGCDLRLLLAIFSH